MKLFLPTVTYKNPFCNPGERLTTLGFSWFRCTIRSSFWNERSTSCLRSSYRTVQLSGDPYRISCRVILRRYT